MKKQAFPLRKSRGPIKRIAIEVVADASGKLKDAINSFVPDSLTQRKAFAVFMPELYVLRYKGYSFAQITSLLNECDLSLKPASVRLYYNQFLEAHEEKYKDHLGKYLSTAHESQNHE